MSAPENLMDVYIDELKDLVSANEQMVKVVRELAEKAEDSKLAKKLKGSLDGIESHTETVRGILSDHGESGKEHCKGMEGLVKEARKHVLEEDIDDGDVRDVVLISQYQRMCHYGICGFGTAKAYADALRLSGDKTKLDQITEDIYGADDWMTDLAERSVNLQAKS